jgi:DNA replication protein DnaC
MRPIEEFYELEKKFNSTDYESCPVCGKEFEIKTLTFDELSDQPISFSFRVAKCDCYGRFQELTKKTNYLRKHAQNLHRLFKHEIPPFRSVSELQDNEKYREAIDAFKSGKNVILTGGVGTGKTHTCYSAFWEIADSGEQVLMLNAPRLFQFCLRPFEETTEEQVNTLCDIDYLILDDIGAYKSLTDFQEDRLYVIIDSRYQGKKPTMIATQAKVTELIVKLSERIFSRLAEFGKLVKINGEDWRLK